MKKLYKITTRVLVLFSLSTYMFSFGNPRKPLTRSRGEIFDTALQTARELLVDLSKAEEWRNSSLNFLKSNCKKARDHVEKVHVVNGVRTVHHDPWGNKRSRYLQAVETSLNHAYDMLVEYTKKELELSKFVDLAELCAIECRQASLSYSLRNSEHLKVSRELSLEPRAKEGVQTVFGSLEYMQGGSFPEDNS